MGDGADSRQHAARRAERRVFRQAFRLAHRGSGREIRNFTREAQDGWALRSQQRFRRRRRRVSSKPKSPRWKSPRARGTDLFQQGRDTTALTPPLEILAQLKPAFRKDGTITAGNAPGLNSAASAMIVADAAWPPTSTASKPDGAARFLRHRRGRARHVRPRPDPRGPAGVGARRLEDRAMSSASKSTKPSPPSRSSSRASLDLAKISSMSRAAPSLMAIPIGATGAILTTRLLHSMQRDGLEARHGHAVHRRRAGHRAGTRNGALNEPSWNGGHVLLMIGSATKQGTGQYFNTSDRAGRLGLRQ